MPDQRVATTLIALLYLISAGCSAPDMENPQNMPLAPTIILGSSTPADDSFADILRTDVVPTWNAEHASMPLHAFQADRGELDGEFLLGWSGAQLNDVTAGALEASGLTGSLADPSSYTEYALVGAESAGSLPSVELLGIHRVEILPERADEFASFVADSIYPTFQGRAPGMRLLYYRGVEGAEEGEHILIFTFDTIERREDYFPTGEPETQALTDAFAPMQPLGDSLAEYQVPGSYLGRDTGLAAAIFEAVDWTDYAHLGATGD